MTLDFDYLNTPVGPLKLIASPEGLVAILWPDEIENRNLFKSVSKNENNPHIELTKIQLLEYFQGKRLKFDLQFDLQMGTDFQKKVWNQLSEIEFGKTKSYKEIAVQIKNPKASRGVGSANRLNPLSIVVPCHRVIGSNGKLTGFAGGLNVKSWLLEFEKKTLASQKKL